MLMTGLFDDKNTKAYVESYGINHGIEVLRFKELMILDKFMSIPMILFNDKEIIYINDSCMKMLEYTNEDLSKNTILNPLDFFEKKSFDSYMNFILGQNISSAKKEVIMINKNKDIVSVELIGKNVIYNSKKCVLACIKDITYLKKLELDLSRTAELRSIMLEITRIALKTEDINVLFQFILEKALKSIKRGIAGTIMTKDGEYFTVASHIGFSNDIMSFRLPIKDSFLYKATNGKLDRIANVSDLMTYKNYYPIKLIYGEEKYIKSTLTAPIYVKGNLFGMISIDSVETNSFDEDDVKSMEFIRYYIEIVLSNYLLYKEKSNLAKYDQLTNLYNRHYIEEFEKILIERALDFKESFNLIVFDLNDLKIINDYFGHLTGDEVIKRFAEELKNNVRKTDILWRLGGDEFAGVFFDSNMINLNDKFQSLLSKMENHPFIVNGNKIKCTFSYGIASFPQDGIVLKDLIKVADNNMYAFKNRYKSSKKYGLIG